MNTNQSANSVPSQGILQKLSKKLPSRAVALLAGWGLIAAPDNNAVAHIVPSTNIPTMTQAGTLSEARQVKQEVSAILVQPPENALRAEALQILNQVRKQRSFNNTAQQERFFHILAALDQNVPLDKAVFVRETDGVQYLKLAPRKIFREFKIDSYDLSRFIV